MRLILFETKLFCLHFYHTFLSLTISFSFVILHFSTHVHICNYIHIYFYSLIRTLLFVPFVSIQNTSTHPHIHTHTFLFFFSSLLTPIPLFSSLLFSSSQPCCVWSPSSPCVPRPPLRGRVRGSSQRYVCSHSERENDICTIETITSSYQIDIGLPDGL